jgi:beta-aspartyl-peptidase (threonine type)
MFHRGAPIRFGVRALLVLVAAGMLGGLASAQDETEAVASPRWAIAVHGGAGKWSREMPADQREAVERSLREALAAGQKILAAGGSALDAVETVVAMLEDDPQFNAGRGAVFTHAGTHELDAAIMDGATLRTGAVAGVTTVKNPVRAARLVMERSTHVLLVGAGADEFAVMNGCERVGQAYFFTSRRFRELEEVRAAAGLAPLGTPAYGLPDEQPGETQPVPEGAGGTVGCVALDADGRLAAATSTGGLTGKLPGRVGDAPICGAGTFADGRCAVSCTGQGEQFIRHGIARRVAWLVVERGLAVDEAARQCLEEVLQPGDGGLIAVDRAGRISMRATTVAMPRGAADSSGRFETAIWFDE